MSLFNKLPMLSGLNMRNVALGNVISLCKNVLSLSAFAYFGNIFVCKLPVPCVDTKWPPPFARTIRIIFRLCSYFKVFWIHTWWVITSMHNYFPSGDFPNKPLIGISMGPYGRFSGKEKYAVPVSVFSAGPQPARIGFFYPVFKNIAGAKKWVFTQTPCLTGAHVTRPAKLSAYRLFGPAQYAGYVSSRLVCHLVSIVAVLNICHNHGVG